jgi:hypothetical protein
VAKSSLVPGSFIIWHSFQSRVLYGDNFFKHQFRHQITFLRESQNLSSGTLQLLELFDYWNSSISFTSYWISSITLNIILATVSINSYNLQTLLHQLRTLLDLE